MFLISLHKDIFLIKPLSIFSDIDHIVACNMCPLKTEAGDNILFDIDNSQLEMCDQISMVQSS